jgi:tetratricopeptide (TPR) repeat protein
MKNILFILLIFSYLSPIFAQNYEDYYKLSQDSIENYNYSAGYFYANMCVKMEPKRDSSYTLRGYCAGSFSNHSASIADGQKAIELNPNNAYAYFICALANVNIPIPQSEQDSLLDYFRLYGEDSFLNIINNYKMPNGTNEMSYYNYGKTFNLLQKAYELDTTYSYAVYMIGYYYSELNQSDSAIKYYTKAITINQDEAEYYVSRGLEFKRQYKSKESLEDFTKAIKIDPNNGTAYSNRAYLKEEQLDDQTGACQDLKKAQKLGSYSQSYYDVCE